MAEWSTWIQLVLSAGLGGGITGSAAFYAARFTGKTATVNAEKDRDHQMVIKQKELDAKQHSETLTRAVDLVADVVSTTTKIERDRLTPMNLQLREYREIFARQAAIEPEFSNPANNFGNRGETPDERRLQQIRRRVTASPCALPGLRKSTGTRLAGPDPRWRSSIWLSSAQHS
ncbi:hypothetical protein GCM10020255_025030 [Rhodococcus baikonurensis]